MKVSQVLGEVISPQEARLSLARAVTISTIHTFHLLLVMNAAFVALQIRFAREGLVASLLCGGDDAVADELLILGGFGSWGPWRGAANN
jgi:hypothetical protein